MAPSGWYKEFMAGYGFDIGGYKPIKAPPGPPMDLANMRQNGVCSLAAHCHDCAHQAVINMDGQPGHLTVKSFEPRLRCTNCNGTNISARPNWREKPDWKQPP